MTDVETCRPTTEPQPIWMRVDALVKQTGISKALIYKWMENSLFPSVCVKINEGSKRGLRLIDLNDFNAFLKSRERGGIHYEQQGKT
jgi:predicted DNA-binding transcriptional regulator AlpA